MAWNKAVLCLSGLALAAQGGDAQTLTAAQVAKYAVVAAPSGVISTMDAPFLFTYGTWQNKAKIENGRAILGGAGVTPKGGGGCNLMPLIDLSAKPDYSPALKVKVGAANKMGTIRLMLRDMEGHAATFEFPLPPPGDGFTLITPKEGASLAKPNSLDKPGQNLNLKQIQQWQFGGDYSSDLPIDVEISAISVVAPSEAAKAARAEKAKADADALIQKKREQDAKRAQYKRGENSPKLQAVYTVAPDILAFTVQAGTVRLGGLTKYAPQTGDKQVPHGGHEVHLERDGKEIGWLIGPTHEHLVTFEKLEGDPLLDFVADDPQTFTISSKDDAAFSGGIKPAAVYRKSKPNDWAQVDDRVAVLHTVYLKLPQPLTEGKHYEINVGDLNINTAEISFSPNAAKVWSEAIHINQVGFRPDDPIKRAFLSVWLGSGGAHRYADGLKFDLRFDLIDAKTGRSAYSGRVALAKDAAEPEAMWKSQNFNLTSVYKMEFSDFKTPGKYRIAVAGVGCSYPFEIGRDVWKTAFLTQMKGLYNERSGVEGGPPYSDYKHGRDFYPGDPGVKITQSKYAAMENGQEAYSELVKGDTGVPVPNAWGGYHDAGDWNPRRVTHMKVTQAQLELLELFPQTFAAMKLSIPPTPKVPDILTEARFELDCFKRLQKPDGGMPLGIETEGDPIGGEVSWIQSMPAYVFAPDANASYFYAGVAARVARLLKPYDPKAAADYQASAVKAMQWAEADFAQAKADGRAKKWDWSLMDSRNFSALQLYITTDATHWRDVFMENTCLNDPNKSVFQWGDHVQRDAAFAYAHLDPKLADPEIQKNAVKQVLAEADKALNYASGNAFNLTTPDKGKPMFIGFYSTPDAIELARAHYLTHDAKYLAGAVQACQFGMGANPSNLVYTTGLGSNPYKHPLHLDSRHTGQPAPAGFTPFANIDFSQWHDNFTTWPITYHLGAVTYPDAYSWPTTEAFFDVYLYPAMTEFTVDRWEPNVYVWGYLAARP